MKKKIKCFVHVQLYFVLNIFSRIFVGLMNFDSTSCNDTYSAYARHIHTLKVWKIRLGTEKNSKVLRI